MRVWLPTLLLGLLTGGPIAAGAADGPVPARQDPPQAQAPAATAPRDYLFPTGAGMLFFYVRADRATDFEAVVDRLTRALAASADAEHQAQAEGWRVFRSVESHPDRIYVFVFDPAVMAVDYDPVRLLSVLLPDEVPDLYGRLKDAVIKIERMGLVRTR